MIRIAHQLEPKRKRSDETSKHLSESWRALEKVLDQVVRTANDPGMVALLPEFRESIISRLGQWDPSQIESCSHQVRAMALLSRALRPLSQSVEGALRTFRSIAAAERRWQQTP